MGIRGGSLLRTGALGFALALGVRALVAAPPACSCVEAKTSDGWCEGHRVGYIASRPIPSRLLHEALDAHGHAVDLTTFTCPSCRAAIEAGGFCDRDSVGFVQGQAYFSRLTYEIARGSRTDPAGIDCATCRKHAEDLGWCDRCAIGRIGSVAIRDRAAYERAARAFGTVREALAVVPRCERCAVAMVTSSECPVCRIAYRDGKPVDPAAAPAAR